MSCTSTRRSWVPGSGVGALEGGGGDRFAADHDRKGLDHLLEPRQQVVGDHALGQALYGVLAGADVERRLRGVHGLPAGRDVSSREAGDDRQRDEQEAPAEQGEVAAKFHV
jgi:hypothetical protein